VTATQRPYLAAGSDGRFQQDSLWKPCGFAVVRNLNVKPHFVKLKKAALPGRPGGQTKLDNRDSITNAHAFQTSTLNSQSPTSRPLKTALIHVCQVRLLLLRSRSEVLDRSRCECLDRLLQAVDRIGSSLEWLGTGGPSEDVIPAVSAGDADLVSAEVLR
jgi:hypothetical protein